MNIRKIGRWLLNLKIAHPRLFDLLALTLALLFVCLSGRAQIGDAGAAQLPEATEIHGHHIGETMTEFFAIANVVPDKNNVREAPGTKDDIWVATEVKEASGLQESVSKHKQSWNWLFHDSKLDVLYFEDFGPFEYDILLAKTMLKYGKPTEESAAELENGFGAKSYLRVATWVRENGDKIELTGYPASTSNEVMLSVDSKRSVDAAKKAAEEYEKNHGLKL